MLQRSQIKDIQSLRLKKYRQANGAYIVEGEKLIHELLTSDREIKNLFATKAWLDQYAKTIPENVIPTEITEKELKKISALKTPNSVLAEVGIIENSFPELINKGAYFALQSIRDPGNFGTIIRIADWFGFAGIMCSEDCVEVYNPKVVQASMGSVFRIPIYYVDLEDKLKQVEVPKFAAVMAGDNLNSVKSEKDGIIVIGNESQGLSKEIIALTNHQISIPKFGKAESLNAAIASGILAAYLKGD